MARRQAIDFTTGFRNIGAGALAERISVSNRRSSWTPGLLASFIICGCALSASAQTAAPPVTLGAGLQTSFVHDEPDEADGTDSFVLNSVRFYVNGNATDKIKFMVNTDIHYGGGTSDINILDAVARLEFSDKFNIWVGRFLPPSDRANLYGPYYSHHWSVYTDGVQDGYPFIFQGRDNGAAYWGQFGKVKVSGGRVRWRDGDRRRHAHRRGTRAGRFLGSGSGLLPERHLLR